MRSVGARGGVRSGVRVRSVVAAVLVVAAGLGVGSTVLLTSLNRALVSSVDAGALIRANAVARTLQVSGTTEVRQDLLANPPIAQVVQVVDDSGRVVASSSTRGRTEPLSALRAPPGTVNRSEVDRIQLLEADDPYLFLAEGAQSGGAGYTVLVASSLQAARQSVRTVLTFLAISSPILLALVGVATWLVIGRSLAPVERIRTRVARISGARLEERVPVPESADEIARLAVTMNEMLDRLQQSHTVQRQFVSDASHELRSPVATLAAALEVAATQPDLGGSELRDVMALETSRMGRLVEDLLLLARSDDEGIRLRSADIDLDDLVSDEATRLRMSAGQPIAVAAAPQPARTCGDEARIAQLLRNLADNAVRHARSRVRLGSVPGPAGPELVVEDDGPGIPAADRERAFDRFVRLENSRDRGSGGSGLGLAIVREIASAHHAIVVVDTSPLGGARIRVRFPPEAPDGRLAH